MTLLLAELETILEAMNLCHSVKMFNLDDATICSRILNQYPRFERHYNHLRKAIPDDG